jgi:hypothetical protein
MKTIILLSFYLAGITTCLSQNLQYQFSSTSQKITKANYETVSVNKNQTRYFWIMYTKGNNWVSIQDKPVSESHTRNYYETFTITSVNNLSNGCKRIWTLDGNNSIVSFYLDDQAAEPYILRTNNDSKGEIVKTIYYYLD